MVFNAIFNNISVISLQSVLLVEETGVPGGNRRPVASYWQTLSHNVASSTPRHERGEHVEENIHITYDSCITHCYFNERE